MLHCGHPDITPTHRIWKVPRVKFGIEGQGVLPFNRPDGTFGEASWIIICEDCFQATGGMEIRGDGTWKGD